MDKDLELRKRCLTLISHLAARAASSPYAEHAELMLKELKYALSESPSDLESMDSVATSDELYELDQLCRLLKFIDSNCQRYTAYHVLKFATRSTWN